MILADPPGLIELGLMDAGRLIDLQIVPAVMLDRGTSQRHTAS